MTIEFQNIIDASEDLIEIVRNWRNSNQVSRYMITNHHITIKEHQRWIERLRTTNTAKAWLIRYEGKPVGLVSLSDIDYINKTTEWGFYIADESVRGKGIGSATLYMLMDYIFVTMGLHSMSTFVLENNPVAIRMYEKFGFQKDQKTLQQLVRDEKQINIYVMRISKEEWDQRKKEILHPSASDLF
jgi:UDP-4-amino-4,6-dideoxy-N-acetyl-beta-L-altrosamine N-acetyltransferase